jgi:tetratricopeptide (TPR) repeat protein
VIASSPRTRGAPVVLLTVVGVLGFLPLFPASVRGEGQSPSRRVAELVEEATRAMRSARETGDPTWYGHARASVDRALDLDATDFGALRAKAWVLLGQHEFREARALADDAIARDPDDWASWANLTDALVELGEYERAVVAADRLATLRPGVPAYTRVAGLQALLGDRATAIATLEVAVAAAEHAEPEALAWTLVHLGHEHFALGDLAGASDAYERGLTSFPGYHLALVGLARARAAQGRIAEAITLASRAADRVPAPAVYGLLGDLYTAAGNPAEAERQFELVRVMERLAAAQGTSYGREVALFLADHDRDLADALRLAREDAARRGDVHGDDVLAWALYKNGRAAEAKRASTRVLRLGTEDAAFHYHAGMIARALAQPRAATRHLERALALDPSFDVRQAPMARAALDAVRHAPDTRLALAREGDAR